MVRDTRKPMPWMVKPPMMTVRAWLGFSMRAERFPACGPMMRRGYAGKIHMGVMRAIVKVWVDHLVLCQCR